MESSTAASHLLDGSEIRSREQQDHMFHDFQQSLTFSEVMLEIKMLFAIALPMVVTGLLTFGKSSMSTLFLGRLSKDALAGGSLALGIANISAYSVISGLASGMEAISSQAFGAKQWRLMGQTLQRTVTLLLLACIPITLLWLNIQPVLLILNQDPTISSTASKYLTYCFPDLVFISLIHPLKIYLRSQNITLPLILSAAFALVLHWPVNSVVVKHMGLGGVQGVARAVAITDFILLVFLVVYIAFSGNRSPWFGGSSLSVLCCIDREWKSVITLAVPSCCAVCLEWWWYEIVILLSGLLPDAATNLAAMNILIQATSLFYIFPHSLSAAVSTRVGHELGANRPNSARYSHIVARRCAIIISIVAAFLLIVFADAWGRIFTNDKATLDLTAKILPVIGLCELGNCLQTTGSGVLRGTARPRVGALINFLSFYIVGLPLAVLLAFPLKLGLLGLWLGLLGAQIVCASCMIWALKDTDWAEEARRARELIGTVVE